MGRGDDLISATPLLITTCRPPPPSVTRGEKDAPRPFPLFLSLSDRLLRLFLSLRLPLPAPPFVQGGDY